MRSIKFHLFTIVFVFCSSFLTAQQEYKLSDYGGPGTLYLYNRLTNVVPFQGLTTAGANVTWDLRSDLTLTTHPTRIITASQGIDALSFFTICALGGNSTSECFSIWTSTEQALLLQDSIELFGFVLKDLQRYQNMTSNRLLENFFGFTVNFGGLPTQGVIVYNSPDTILEFPVQYNDSWSSNVDWFIDLNAIGQNIRYNSEQRRVSRVDAWGTVMTPYDTFTNVIRVRSEVMHSDTFFTDSLDIPINVTEVEYMWLDTNYKLPIMIARGIVTGTLETINVVEYIYEKTCLAPTWDLELAQNVFYLDQSGAVTIDFQITNPNADEYTWDFGDGLFEVSEGSISHTYYAGGTYAVGVTGCMTNCLPLNSCTSDIIDFVIIDTVSAVEVIPADKIGIKLFPNPVKESMSVYIPDHVGPQHYQIFDLTGRVLTSGILNPGTTYIKNDVPLPNGIYSILFENAGFLGTQMSVLRFSVLN